MVAEGGGWASGGDKPYEGEDICKPYNVTAQMTGVMNEWRDKKQEWDELVNTLNTKLFGNQGFKES